MKKVIVLSFITAVTSIGCPSKKKDQTPIIPPRVEDFKAGDLNKELEEALNAVSSENGPMSVKTSCPDSILEDLDVVQKGMYQCGAIRVPEFHNKDSVRHQGLAYLKVSFGHGKKPLLIIEQGGPGDSSMELTKHYLSLMPEILQSFDVLAVEQRGTPWTRPVATCEATVDYELKALDGHENKDENELSNILRSCLKDISERMDVSSISTYQIAGDLVYAARHFGYEKFSYYGVSYGTLVGQYLLNYHAPFLEKTVLDSPVVPGKDWMNDALMNMENVLQTNLESYIKSRSGWAGSAERALGRFVRMADSLDQNPISLKYDFGNRSKNFDFKGEHFKSIVFFLLTSSYLPDVLDQIVAVTESRDSAPQMVEMLFGFLAKAILSVDESVTSPMYQSIICREFEIEQIKAAEILSHFVMIKSLATEEELKTALDSGWRCSLGFQKKSDDDPTFLSSVVRSDKSVLVVGGEVDHVTKPEYVPVVAKHLSNSHQAVFKGVGHGALGKSECINKSILDYFKDSQNRFENHCE